MTVSPLTVCAYTVKNTAKDDGMSIDFMGTPRKNKTLKYYLILGG